jgi:hypothetical protein
VEVLEQAAELLKKHLPLEADGCICTTEDLIHFLLGAAANCGTVQALGSDLVDSPDPETIGDYLREQLRVEDLFSRPALLWQGRARARAVDTRPSEGWDDTFLPDGDRLCDLARLARDPGSAFCPA